ncbi:hypothetical protein [Methylovorus glucosotrophus]|uniref:hypothetical protein n=1 Tax=Methylovorus glucosotrophus TaxID=266009 RepID=UPI00167F8A4E|nr:hypothetical protein [Methylovorus glucosotrophus]
MKSKLLLSASVVLLATLLSACNAENPDDSKPKVKSDEAANTQLLSDEELQKKIHDRR